MCYRDDAQKLNVLRRILEKGSRRGFVIRFRDLNIRLYCEHLSENNNLTHVTDTEITNPLNDYTFVFNVWFIAPYKRMDSY